MSLSLHVEVVGSHPPLEAKQKDLDAWYHHGMSAYQTDSRIDDYIQTLAFLAAGDLPAGARADACRRPGGEPDHQAYQAALFYAAGQHLRAAGSKGSP
jgi:hypothetical protein